jgi:hypothetical protein
MHMTDAEPTYTVTDVAQLLKRFVDGLCAIPDCLHRDILEYELATHCDRRINAAYDALVATDPNRMADDERPESIVEPVEGSPIG